MRIPIITATASFICVAATTTGRFEFVLAERLGDDLRIRSRDAQGREKWMHALFSSEPIYAPRTTGLGIVTANNQTIPIPEFSRIAWGNPVDFDIEENYGGSFPIGLSSDMFRQLRDAILIPQNGQHVLITNPVDAGDFCSDNRFEFLSFTSRRSSFGVTVEVLPVDETSIRQSITGQLELSPESFSKVPSNIFNFIQNEVNLVGCTPEAMARLPTILYDFGNIQIEMIPEDYVENVDGECQLKIEQSYRFTWGTNMLRNLAVLFDYRQDRIGICDAR